MSVGSMEAAVASPPSPETIETAYRRRWSGRPRRRSSLFGSLRLNCRAGRLKVVPWIDAKRSDGTEQRIGNGGRSEIHSIDSRITVEDPEVVGAVDGEAGPESAKDVKAATLVINPVFRHRPDDQR